MKNTRGSAKTAVDERPIAPVTIFDADGRVVRVVPAAEFQKGAAAAREAVASRASDDPLVVLARPARLRQEMAGARRSVGAQ